MFFFLIFAINLFSSIAYAQNPPQSTFLGESDIVPGSPIKAYEYKLQNNLKVIVVPDHRNSIATMHFILNAGSDREHFGTTGLAHFFEHMMFRKTKDAPQGNYDLVLNSVGGTGNASTADSFVTFYSNFPAPALDTMLKLESQRFMNLDLAEPYFSTEKGAVISERKLRVENDPLQRSFEVLRSITERNTGMEWMTIGSKADVENMKLDSALKFYENFYTPDNTLIVIGGPFQPQEVVKSVAKYFSNWHGAVQEKHTPLPKDYFTRDLNKSFVCSDSISTKQYRIVYPSPRNSLKDTVYALVFQSILDDNPQGTFERRLVKKNLATRFYFYKTYWQDETNPLIATFLLSKDQSFDALKPFWLENVKEVRQKNISEKIKLQVAKQLKVSNAETAERMTSLVNTILDNTFFFHNFHAAGEAEKIVNSMTAKDFSNWIDENLAQFYVTGIVPTGDAPSCAEFYKQFFSKNQEK